MTPKDEAAAHNRLGVDFFLTRELDAAIDQFREAARLWPGYAEAYANLGVALAKQGDLTGALAAWAQARRLDPSSVPVHYHPSALVSYNYGVSLLRDGRLDDAMAEWRAALRIQPDFAEAHYALGLGFLLRGHAAMARQRFDEARALRPDWVAAHYQAGMAAYALREWDAAEQAWRAALELDPNYAPAYVNLGLVKLLDGQAADAIGFFTKALALDRHLPQAHFNLGLALFARGDTEEAVRAFRRSLELDPELIRAHVALGNAWLAKGEWAKAVAAWRRALRLAPGDPQASELQYHIGLVLSLLGDPQGSVSALRQAVRLRPHWVPAQYQLGVALAGLRQWSDSRQAFERVAELRPSWPQGLFALGKARYHAGDHAGAIEALRRAVSLDGEFAEAALQLGVILRATGRLDEAFAAIHRAAVAGLPAAQELVAAMYENGSGVDRRVSMAMLWWFRTMKADASNEAASMAEDRLSAFRRQLFRNRVSEEERVEIQSGFAAIREDIRRRVAGTQAVDGSVGLWLSRRGATEAVTVLIEEALAMDARAHAQLESLLLHGRAGLVEPFDARILAYIVRTAREGFDRSCRLLRVGRVQEHLDARQWRDIRDVLERCGE